MNCKDGGLILALAYRQVTILSVMIAGVPAEIRTRYHPNVSQERYWYVRLFLFSLITRRKLRKSETWESFYGNLLALL
jgi:hypothetical protein